MPSARAVPRRVCAQLEDGETVVAVVAARRRGTHAETKNRAEVAAGAVLFGLMSSWMFFRRKETPKGLSMPRKAFVALTDRRLLIVARGPFGGDREAGRPIALNRIRDASMRGREHGRVVARIGLLAGSDLEVEVSRKSGDDLAALVAHLQAMTVRRPAEARVRRDWPLR